MELKKLNNKLKEGNTYTILSGEYHNNRIHIKSSGTKENPITIQNQGNVLLTKKTTLRITGSHIIFQGFTFQNINVNKMIRLEGNDIRFTKNQIYNLEKDVERIISVKGERIRIDNNLFRYFDKLGCLICVDVFETKPLFCMIDHNKFNDRKPTDKNNGLECIRIGDSKSSLYDSKTTIYNNMFNNINGEIEIISIKSCRNLILNNKITNSQGTITLRHGQFNKVLWNYINADNNDNNGGIRIMDSYHTIMNNTFENISDENPFRSPISVMSGQVNNKLKGYAPVHDVNITNNDFINCYKVFSLGVNNKSRSNIEPFDVTIRNNRLIKCYSMFNDSDKIVGYKDFTITNNPIFKYDQKLNLRIDKENYEYNIQEFYEKEYEDIMERNVEVEEKEETEEKKSSDFKCVTCGKQLNTDGGNCLLCRVKQRQNSTELYERIPNHSPKSSFQDNTNDKQENNHYKHLVEEYYQLSKKRLDVLKTILGTLE
jgi:hypothetical protein